MKLATFRRDGVERIGVVHSGDARLFDLAAACEDAPNPAFHSMLALIEADDAGLDAARDLFARRGAEAGLSVAVSAVQLLAPLPRAAPDARRDVLRHPYPSVAARLAGPRGAARSAARRLSGRRWSSRSAFWPSLPEIADLLHHQSPDSGRAGRDGSMAALQRGDGL